MNNQTQELSLKERISAPSPNFFKKIRNAGLLLGAIGTAIISSPITLPAAVITAAGYMLTAGLVATAVSTVTVKHEKD